MTGISRSLRGLVAGVGVVLAACGAPGYVQQSVQESTRTYTAPADLDADPQTTGLLLVDAVTTKALNTMPLAGVVIAAVDDASNEIAVGSFKTGGMLGQLSDVVVVPGLQPARYRIVRLRTANVNMWETLDLPATPEFEVEIGPGRPVYLGQIQVKHPFGSTAREIRVRYDPAREAASWKRVLDRFAASPWAPLIDTHATSLK